MLSLQPSAASLLSGAVAKLTAHGIVNPRLEAEVLLAHTLTTGRAGLYARLHDSISLIHAETFSSLIQRRIGHEPLHYVTGVREFWSLEFTVDRRVLIPRPETERVVEVTLYLLSRSIDDRPSAVGKVRLLDIGTGSGCIAIALAKELPQAEIWATDISQDALTIAYENAQRHGVAEQIRFLQGDILTPTAEAAERFDVLVSNPPYIRHNDLAVLQPEIRDWEPHSALDGGSDGLDFSRRLINEGPAYLRPGGWLIMEIAWEQHSDVMHLIQEQSDLATGYCVPDYAGHNRVAVARKG